jgi:nucleoside-diphosphate-sugar epimerase
LAPAPDRTVWAYARDRGLVIVTKDEDFDRLALITGAAGFVGSRMVQRFLREGMSVRALDQRPVEVAGVESVVGSVTDPGAVQRAMAGSALVVHCAAVIAGTPEETTRVNTEGTRVLLEAAVQAGCERFLYISTAAVYALADQVVVDESTPFLQEGPAFHLSRVRAEQAVWEASARGLAVTVFRPHFIFGAHPTSTWSAVLAQRMVKGEFVLPGDGSGSWPYVHVDNLVEAVITATHTAQGVGQALQHRRWTHDGARVYRPLSPLAGVGCFSHPSGDRPLARAAQRSEGGAGVGLRAPCVV